MTEPDIRAGNGNHLSIASEAVVQNLTLMTMTCSFCDQSFKLDDPKSWSQECEPCRTCPECGSRFTVRYYPSADGNTGPKLARCMACLHGWSRSGA